MNFIAVIILLTLIINFILDLAADILNLGMVKNELPKGFEDVYDTKRYAQSQEYLKVNTRFGWISTVFDLIVLLIFWFAKGFPILDNWVRSFGFGPVLTGLIYMGILVLCKSILDLPFGIYSTFVIEERFGFNKTTWKTYVTDMIKGIALSIIIGTPLLAAVLAFFEYAGDSAWLYCWIAVTLFSLILQFIAPTWIMPLFNKFTPLEEGELRNAIMDYARSVNFPLANLFVMDGSKRSGKSNAFFTGFGKNKRIALFDTLIEKHTVSELVAVLAHEIGHYKKKHILQTMIAGIIHMGVIFYLLSFFISYQGLFDAFYMENMSVYAGLIFFGMLFSPIDFFLGILMQMWSRKNEYEADRFSAETTKDPESMISALKKLAAGNLSNLVPHPLYVFLHYSHPPMIERVRAIKETAKV
ncbi:Peptidase, M48 family [Desulfonema limicola]|uniref:Peptidase, M48 family n=1 Tax=Desulfonema limicola TaxID=45656 RepID=A0A975GHR9_9BACT|nr:M48 family metallopeptidase [Desulfonema limicola]QTA81732.1 Peptidase, M48 family [Desulfonema limicola]